LSVLNHIYGKKKAPSRVGLQVINLLFCTDVFWPALLFVDTDLIAARAGATGAVHAFAVEGHFYVAVFVYRYQAAFTAYFYQFVVHHQVTGFFQGEALVGYQTRNIVSHYTADE
jgi:hypothetical protein